MLFGDPIMQRGQEEEVVNGGVRRFLASCPVTSIADKPEVHHPEPNMEEEEAMYLSWRHPMATNEVGSVDPPYNMVTPIRGGHE